MDRSAKEAQVAELKELLLGRSSVVLTNYAGMKVAEMYELRREFDKIGAGYRVVKNTLARLAIQGTEYEFLGKSLTGTIGVVFGDDPVATAKVLTEFTKKNQRLSVKLGFLGGKPLQAGALEALSRLPGKDQLRAQLLSTMKAPAQQFVGVLAAGPRNFVGVLNARKDKLAAA